MSQSIQTEIQHTLTPDDGVVTEFTADETFDSHGERVERETTVGVLEDGGVHISQATDQGSYDSLTLSATVVDELLSHREQPTEADGNTSTFQYDRGDTFRYENGELYDITNRTKDHDTGSTVYVLECVSSPTQQQAVGVGRLETAFEEVDVDNE